MPTATLDYNAFPHIIDRVLVYTSWSDLATCRLTCKAVRDEVTRLQGQHIALHRGWDGNLSVRSLWGQRIPGLREGICIKIDKIKDEVARIKPFTSHTRVLELEGNVGPADDLTLLADAFPNLDIFRLTTDRGLKTCDPLFPFPCKTLVIFYSDDQGGLDYDSFDEDEDEDDEDDGDDEIDEDYEIEGHDDDDDNDQNEVSDELDEEDDLGRRPPALPSGAFPEGVTKIVVNMRGSDFPVADWFDDISNFPETVKDFVLVYPKYRINVTEGSFSSFYENIVVMDTAELISTRAQYTLVGAEEAGEDFDRMNLLLWTYMRTSYHFDDCINQEKRIDEHLDHVTVLTKAEYAKTVDNIDLETVERLDGDDDSDIDDYEIGYFDDDDYDYDDELHGYYPDDGNFDGYGGDDSDFGGYDVGF